MHDVAACPAVAGRTGHAASVASDAGLNDRHQRNRREVQEQARGSDAAEERRADRRQRNLRGGRGRPCQRATATRDEHKRSDAIGPAICP